MAHTESNHGHSTRLIHLLFAAVIAAAIIGFFIGLDYGVPKPDATTGLLNVSRDASADFQDVIPALTYAEVAASDIGPNRSWKSSLSKLPSAQDASAPPTIPDQSVRLASFAARAERRAFNGAPPIIPHDVQQMTTNNCLACHGEALQVANRTASLLSHPEMTNCMQCHAPVAASPFQEFTEIHSSFSGLQSPLEGARAWQGAPPVVPHSTYMRENCLACHGPAGLAGLRTTHPERQSCLQCHAPSAKLNQTVDASASFFLLPPSEKDDS